MTHSIVHAASWCIARGCVALLLGASAGCGGAVVLGADQVGAGDSGVASPAGGDGRVARSAETIVIDCRPTKSYVAHIDPNCQYIEATTPRLLCHGVPGEGGGGASRVLEFRVNDVAALRVGETISLGGPEAAVTIAMAITGPDLVQTLDGPQGGRLVVREFVPGRALSFELQDVVVEAQERVSFPCMIGPGTVGTGASPDGPPPVDDSGAAHTAFEAACAEPEQGIVVDAHDPALTALLVGSWALCARPSVFGTSDEDGLDIGADGAFYKLHRSPGGEMVRLGGFGQQGLWEVGSSGQLDLKVAGVGTVSTSPVFASTPRKMRLNNNGLFIADYLFIP